MLSDPYFYNRAEQELLMAERSRDPCAVRVHYELANRYLDLFYRHEPGRPASRPATDARIGLRRPTAVDASLDKVGGAHRRHEPG